jgi:hypothetical protein
MIVMIKLIIDSTYDLPETYIAENDIKVLPLKILLEDKEYLDGETIVLGSHLGLGGLGIFFFNRNTTEISKLALCNYEDR